MIDYDELRQRNNRKLRTLVFLAACGALVIPGLVTSGMKQGTQAVAQVRVIR